MVMKLYFGMKITFSRFVNHVTIGKQQKKMVDGEGKIRCTPTKYMWITLWANCWYLVDNLHRGRGITYQNIENKGTVRALHRLIRKIQGEGVKGQ
jgi:hypothetical protein